MPNCGAPNCTNRSGDKENLSFHRIPKKEDLRKKWVHNLNRKILAKNIFVCSDHFEPSCFKRDLRCELMNAKPKMLWRVTQFQLYLIMRQEKGFV